MRNLVITGFMATGKTAVGRAVAERLGRPFVDMDAEIERRAGKLIPRIFEEEGEAAFRRLEAALCAELASQQGLVIATGGGTLVDPGNCARMLETSTVVCLSCHVEEILRRLRHEGDPERPLLRGTDLRTRVESLLAERSPAYAAIPWQLDTTGQSVEEIAGRICELAQEQRLEVRHPAGCYPVHIGCGLLSEVGRFLGEAGFRESRDVAIVSDTTVGRIYGARVKDSLRAAGFRPFLCTIPDGEAHKTLETVSGLYRQFLGHGLDRSSAVVALGGGVVGDVAGFAAATYLRGIPLVQVPTTLLAMVDASVGGKTGVNLPEGKNLVGAFHHPRAVIMDPEVLMTLPVEQLRTGIAEAIKHAVIGDPGLFDQLESGPRQVWFTPALIARTLRVKIGIVEQDTQEQGLRMVLNLGHTVGHALERCTDYRLPHGEAVSLGMVVAARLAVLLRLAEPAVAQKIEGALRAWGLPTRFGGTALSCLWEAIRYDKKRRSGRLRWVLPAAIGAATVREDVPLEAVRAALLVLTEA